MHGELATEKKLEIYVGKVSPSLNDKQRKEWRCPQSVVGGMLHFLQEILKEK